MSKYFVEKNGESTRSLFLKKTIYSGAMAQSGSNNVVPINFAEKIYYGRLDRQFNVIMPRTRRLRKLSNSADPNRPQQVADFVADMFQQMVLQFKKRAAQGKISSNQDFLSNLKVYKGYQDPVKEYNLYKNIYFRNLKARISGTRSRFRNFDEFVELLMPILEVSLTEQPLTYTGFLKSKDCSVMNSGFAIEIADADYISDAGKIQQFVESPNWKFFVNTCNSYGFMVDSNVPWRIIADIGTDEMIAAAQRYSRHSFNVSGILLTSCTKVSPRSYRAFKKDLFDLYNLVRPKRYSEFVDCSDGGVVKKVVKTEDLTYQQFTDKYPEEVFLKLYVKMRLQEEMPDMPEADKEAVIKQQIALMKLDGSMTRLHENFESNINKTFDKRGSLSYNIYSNNAQSKRSFDQGEIANITITEYNDDFSSDR